WDLRGTLARERRQGSAQSQLWGREHEGRVTSRHYDVVVLGRSLGALATAALLARRDFSVLLVGQEQRPPSYRFERFSLMRRSFSLLFGASPVWKRILHELAQSPSFKRHTRALEPMFTLCGDGRRLQVSSDP